MLDSEYYDDCNLDWTNRWDRSQQDGEFRLSVQVRTTPRAKELANSIRIRYKSRQIKASSAARIG